MTKKTINIAVPNFTTKKLKDLSKPDVWLICRNYWNPNTPTKCDGCPLHMYFDKDKRSYCVGSYVDSISGNTLRDPYDRQAVESFLEREIALEEHIKEVEE